MSRVLLIGESCMDIFIYGNTPRLSPEGPAPVFNPINERYNGGMALNVQSNLESLDVGVDIITHTSTITKTCSTNKHLINTSPQQSPTRHTRAKTT